MDPKINGIFGPIGLLAQMVVEETGNYSSEDEDSSTWNQELFPELQNLIETESGQTDRSMNSPKSKDTLNLPCTENGVERNVESIPVLEIHLLTGFVPLTSLPLPEAAFSVETIRNQIFSYLNKAQLIKCRLVCQAWRQYATNEELLDCYENTIFLRKHNKSRKFQASARILVKRKKPLEDFIELLDGTGPNPFPCHSFEIRGSILQYNDPEFQYFLDNHGFRIKTLEIIFEYKNTCFENSENAGSNVCEADLIIQFVVKLLIEQAPNLRNLMIMFGGKFGHIYDHAKSCPRFAYSGLSSLLFRKNCNLRFASLGAYILPEILDCICFLSPKLKEVNTCDFKLFLNRMDKIHLCKQYYFLVSNADFSLEEIDVMEAITSMEEKLELKVLRLRVESIEDEPELNSRVSAICQNLLRNSSNSLETLSLWPLQLLCELEIPQMPHIKLLKFKWDYEDVDRYFSNPVRMAYLFPNLHTVQIHGLNVNAPTMHNILNIFNEVMPSVRVIKPGNNLIDRLQAKRLFPNAIIR